MSKENGGCTDLVRQIVAEADDSLSQSETAAKVKALGRPFSANDVGSVFRRLTETGEFIRNRVDGKWRYTGNPEYVPKPRGVPKGTTPANLFGKPMAAMGVVSTVEVATAQGPLTDAELRALADSIDIVPLASARPLEGGLPALDPGAARDPIGLMERLAAISSDIEDAIGDACDEQFPHAVIKGLVIANGAIARSVRELRA